MTSAAVANKPKPPPRMVAVIRGVLNDCVAGRLGVDSVMAALAIMDQQDQCHDRPVGFYRDQLSLRCGFNPKTPRRLQKAVQALEADGWLEVKRPAKGERAESVYRILDKHLSDPRTGRSNAPGSDTDTGVENAPGDDSTWRISDSSHGAFLTDDMAHQCATPSSSISTSKETTSKENTPLTPQGGEGGGSASESDKPVLGKTKLRKAKTSKFDELVSIAIPESLSTIGFLEAWQSWLEHLKQKGKLPTESAAKAQLKKCVGLGPATAVVWIDNAIEKNWQGLYSPPESKSASKDLFSGPREFLARRQAPVVVTDVEILNKHWNPTAPDGGSAAIFEALARKEAKQ